MSTSEKAQAGKHTSDKHTPEPWAVDSVMSEAMHDICLGYPVPGAGNPVLVASVYYDSEDGIGRISTTEAEANARRIIACVNACKGIASWPGYST